MAGFPRTALGYLYGIIDVGMHVAQIQQKACSPFKKVHRCYSLTIYKPPLGQAFIVSCDITQLVTYRYFRTP